MDILRHLDGLVIGRVFQPLVNLLNISNTILAAFFFAVTALCQIEFAVIGYRETGTYEIGDIFFIALCMWFVFDALTFDRSHNSPRDMPLQRALRTIGLPCSLLAVISTIVSISLRIALLDISILALTCGLYAEACLPPRGFR